MNLSILAVLSVITAAGMVGGYAGYLLEPFDPDLKVRRRQLRKSLVLGIVAALMVPLFLRVVGAASGEQKNLVDQLVDPSSTIGMWLVVTGFCLVAAVFSSQFITGLSKAVLQRLEDKATAADKKASDALQDVEALEEDLQQDATPNMQSPLSDLEKDVLRAVYGSRERRPNLEEIAAMRGWKKDEVSKPLQALEDRLLVRSKIYEDGQRRWRVRTAGKQVIADDQRAH